MKKVKSPLIVPYQHSLLLKTTLRARFSPHYITTWTGYARLFCEPNMRLQFGQ